MSASLLRWGPWGILPTFALGVATLPERIEHRLIRLSEDLPAGLSPMGHTFEDCQIVVTAVGTEDEINALQAIFPPAEANQ